MTRIVRLASYQRTLRPLLVVVLALGGCGQTDRLVRVRSLRGDQVARAIVFGTDQQTADIIAGGP